MKKLISFLVGSLLAMRVLAEPVMYAFPNISNAATGVAPASVSISDEVYGYLDRVQIIIENSTTSSASVYISTYTNVSNAAKIQIYSNAAMTASGEYRMRYQNVSGLSGASTNAALDRYLFCGEKLKLMVGSLNQTNVNYRVRLMVTDK